MHFPFDRKGLLEFEHKTEVMHFPFDRKNFPFDRKIYITPLIAMGKLYTNSILIYTTNSKGTTTVYISLKT